MTEIHGACADGFEVVRDHFADNFDKGLEQGASVAVTVDGDPVVDLWAGHADEHGRPWERDTLSQGFLQGEIVRRVTGRSIGTFFREEVAGPLGADFHIGLPDRAAA